MKAIYIADDGTEFDKELDCVNYERGNLLKKLDNEIIGVDSTGNIIKYSNKDFINDVFIVYLPTKAAVNSFLDRCFFDGYDEKGIEGPGFYIYASDIEIIPFTTYQWEMLDDIIQDYESRLTKLKNFKSIIERNIINESNWHYSQN